MRRLYTHDRTTRAARYPTAVAISCALMLLAADITTAGAQEGGSAGGSIGGNISGSTGGSIGGNIGAPPPPAAIRPAPQPVPHRPYVAPRPQQAVRREAPQRQRGVAGAFDGVWSLATASSCAGNGNGAFRVVGGRLQGRSAGSSASGSVSASGALYSTERFRGMTSVYSGRLSGNSGSGSYQRADGCTGQWTAYR